MLLPTLYSASVFYSKQSSALGSFASKCAYFIGCFGTSEAESFPRLVYPTADAEHTEGQLALKVLLQEILLWGSSPHLAWHWCATKELAWALADHVTFAYCEFGKKFWDFQKRLFEKQ